MKLTELASAMTFAHLLGRDKPFTAKAKADDDGDDDGAMKKSKAKRANADNEDDTDGDGNKTDKKGASAAEDEEEEDEEEEGEKPDGKKAKKAKAKAKDGDADSDDEEEEEDGDKKTRAIARAAVKQERARCAAIFACDAAGNRPDMAAHLAFNTNMSAEDATGMLKAFALGSPKGGRGGLSARMENVKTPNPGPADLPPPDMSSASGVAAMMTGVYNAALGRQSGNQQ
jgi:hypothetical protein